MSTKVYVLSIQGHNKDVIYVFRLLRNAMLAGHTIGTRDPKGNEYLWTLDEETRTWTYKGSQFDIKIVEVKGNPSSACDVTLEWHKKIL